MPVALQPGTVVDGGRVDLGQPENSGLRGLANSLDVAVRSAADIAATAQENEFNQITSLLNDATAGPDEIAEIANDAYFPLNRFAAQNRQGEAMVAANRNVLDDQLASAKDPIEAREILRGFQQGMLAQTNEPGVHAGVRQAVSDLAAPALNAASKKRVEIREAEKRQNEGVILGEAISRSEGEFIAATETIISDQTLVDPSQVSIVHANAAQALLNELAENPASLMRAKRAAYAAIEAFDMEPADRAKYDAVITAAHRLEDKDKEGATEAELRGRAYRAASRAVVEFTRQFPDKPIPHELSQAVFDSAPSPIAANNSLMDLEAARGRTGLLGDRAAEDGRQNLRLRIATLTRGLDEEETQWAPEAIRAYDVIVGAMDPEVMRQTPYEARQQINAAVDTAVAYGQKLQAEKRLVTHDPVLVAQQEAQVETVIQTMKQQWQTATTPEAKAQIRAQLKGVLEQQAAAKEMTAAKKYRMREQEILNMAFEAGVSILEMRME